MAMIVAMINICEKENYKTTSTRRNETLPTFDVLILFFIASTGLNLPIINAGYKPERKIVTKVMIATNEMLPALKRFSLSCTTIIFFM